MIPLCTLYSMDGSGYRQFNYNVFKFSRLTHTDICLDNNYSGDD